MGRVQGTTILAVRKAGRLALGGDGQISVGDTIVKGSANKVRSLKGGRVLAGFAGSVADALNRPDTEPSAERLYNWLLNEQPDYWATIALGRDTERRRLSPRSRYDQYSGRLSSAEMVAQALDVTPQAARRMVLELGLREMTGRGRFRAWGIL